MLFRNRRTGYELDIEFRPFRPGDEAGFRECIEDFYGEGYPYKEYFEPGYLAEKCARGAMLVLCGVTSGGEIVNTCAIRYDGEFPGQRADAAAGGEGQVPGHGYRPGAGARAARVRCEAEVGLAVCGRDDARLRDQHGLATNGFILTGLRPVLYKASVMVPDMAWPEGARLSQAVMCRRGAMEDAGEIYCPAEHRARCGGDIRPAGRRRVPERLRGAPAGARGHT